MFLIKSISLREEFLPGRDKTLSIVIEVEIIQSVETIPIAQLRWININREKFKLIN